MPRTGMERVLQTCRTGEENLSEGSVTEKNFQRAKELISRPPKGKIGQQPCQLIIPPESLPVNTSRVSDQQVLNAHSWDEKGEGYSNFPPGLMREGGATDGSDGRAFCDLLRVLRSFLGVFTCVQKIVIFSNGIAINSTSNKFRTTPNQQKKPKQCLYILQQWN